MSSSNSSNTTTTNTSNTSNKGRAVGIDLGTTYSCVGTWNGTTVDIIANDMGNRTTPSYVAFNETEKLVGDAAKNAAASNASNTVHDAKRLIGRKFSDPVTQKDLKHFPFTVVADSSDRPEIVVTYKGEVKHFKPEEISALVLSKLKADAEAFLGEPVTKAVITVPAYFNDAQRQSTKDAGTIAGLEVLRIINEPTAASMAYHLEKECKQDKVVLIYDLGGGTFDVSLLSISTDSLIQVLATSGDTHLGGEDFDNLLVQHFMSEFKLKSGVDISENKRALRRLKTAAEAAKRTLSSTTNADISIDSLADGKDFNSKISRAKFEQLCESVFKRCMAPLDDVLRTARIDGVQVSKSQVDEIVLVGGSTRVPKIQEMLSDYFNGKSLCKSINPDEAVAYGATVLAATLNREDMGSVDIVVCDVAPLSIGVANMGTRMEVLIPRATTIPTKFSKTFSTAQDYQTAVDIEIYEGERMMVRDNNKLGSFRLSDIPPMPQRDCKIEITIEIDANSIVNVTAVEKSTGNAKNITITNEKGRLSKADIERMVAEAEKFKEDDIRVSETFEAKNSLESLIYNWKKTMSEEKTKEKLTDEELTVANEKLSQAGEWLSEHGDEQTKDLYVEKLKELEQVLLPLGPKLYAAGEGPSSGMPSMGGMGGMPGMPGMPAGMENMSMDDLQKMMQGMGGMGGMDGNGMDGNNMGAADGELDEEHEEQPKVEEID